MPQYPPPLAELIAFFEALSEPERRENLIDLAAAAKSHEPAPDEIFDWVDERKDPECTDTVGVFARFNAAGRLHFAMRLGPRVQTLTRAMAAILCRGLEGATPAEVRELPRDFVPRIIGEQLVRQRSQTVYYVLARLQEAARMMERGGGQA